MRFNQHTIRWSCRYEAAAARFIDSSPRCRFFNIRMIHRNKKRTLARPFPCRRRDSNAIATSLFGGANQTLQQGDTPSARYRACHCCMSFRLIWPRPNQFHGRPEAAKRGFEDFEGLGCYFQRDGASTGLRAPARELAWKARLPGNNNDKCSGALRNRHLSSISQSLTDSRSRGPYYKAAASTAVVNQTKQAAALCNPERTSPMSRVLKSSQLFMSIVVLFAAGCDRAIVEPAHTDLAPQQVLLDPASIAQVSVGGIHTCVLRTDGGLTCWGSNYYGQANPPAKRFTQVSVGAMHTCALEADGTIACWGYNAHGQATPPPGRFTQIAAGNYHTCALADDGTLACWGNDSYGKATPPAGVFTQVTASRYNGEFGFSCALDRDGAIACWGYNGAGQASPPAGTFTHVSAGGHFACALRTDGRLACWGDNFNGQATPPPGLFKQVTAGSAHACARRIDDTLACWGYNTYGQATPPAGAFTQLSAGGNTTCGMSTSGSLLCWGNSQSMQADPPTDRFAELSVGGYTTSYSQTCMLRTDGTLLCRGRTWGNAPTGTFTEVSTNGVHVCGVRTGGTLDCWGPGLPSEPAGIFSHVSVGNPSSHACAIRPDGTIACWGYNTYGQATPPAGAFTQLSAGSLFTCALDRDGAIACWGSNDVGQATPPAGTFTQVSASRDFACAVRTDGTLACWGANAYGQSSPPTGSFTQVSAGRFGPYACALRTDGTLACWGDDLRGRATPPAGRFTQVSAGGTHACALDADGGLSCWGHYAVTESFPPNSAPVASAGGPYGGLEAAAIQFDGTASNDPDGDALTYAWDFGDGATGSGPAPTHTYADDGDYTVTLTVSDATHAPVSAHTVAHVANVAPLVSTLPAAEILVGETYSSSGSFMDPGADSWSAMVDYGAGSTPVPLTGKTFSLQHTYASAGTFTVVVRITDDDGSVGETSATVRVLSPAQGTAQLNQQIESLISSGGITSQDAKPLTELLSGAIDALNRGNPQAALGKLTAFDNRVNALLQSRRISAADATKLHDYSRRLQRSIRG